jgi:hypothetical protein
VSAVSQAAHPHRQRLDRLRDTVTRAWHDAPDWVRSPAAIIGVVTLLVIGLLMALALVVEGVVQRGEQLNQAWSFEQHKHLIASARP